MKKNSLLAIVLILSLFTPSFSLGGLQKQKWIQLGLYEKKEIEILVWSDREEEIEVKSISPEEIKVFIPIKNIKIDPMKGEEIIVLGEKYFNASLLKVQIYSEKEGIYPFSIILTTRSFLSGVSTNKELVFNFIANVSSKSRKIEKDLVWNINEVNDKDSIIVLIIGFVIIFLISYLIYKKS